jgi:phosphopantetheine--protein transferase-like protein
VIGVRQRIGSDVVAVAEVESSIAAFGNRYLDRILTPLERAQSGGRPERVAARFAGKEAVIKLLRPDRDLAIPHLDIEIALLPSGAPHVRLHRIARKRASAESLGDFVVSLTHDGGIAFATALAIRSDRMSAEQTTDTVRSILERYGNLREPVTGLADSDDLANAGLTSHSSVNVMLAIEDDFGLEFPDELLTRSTFASIATISSAIDELRGPSA